MRNRILLVIILWIFTGVAAAQQVPDLKYNPSIPRPAYMLFDNLNRQFEPNKSE